MDHKADTSRRNRESFLSLTLALLFGGGFLLFLILVSGGFFFYVGCIVAVIAALGFMHYAVWGYLMSQSVAAERKALEDHSPHEVNGDAVRDRYGIRRF